MAHSIDLRKRILDYVEAGGRKSEASRLFSVARSTIDRWLAADDPFAIRKTGPKKMRVIDEEALRKHVADFPDLTQKTVLHTSVFQNFVSAMDCENSVPREKKALGYKERCDEKRQVYRQALTEKHDAGKKIVYVDECGFRAESYRRHGYAPKGEPVLDLISGTRTRTMTLVAARIDSTFTALYLFDGSCDAAYGVFITLHPIGGVLHIRL